MDKKEEAGEEKHAANGPNQPIGSVLAHGTAIGRNAPDKNSRSQERGAKQRGFPTVDGGDAPGGVI
jgi:hypothetical protein